MPLSQDDWLDVKESGENYRAFLLRCWHEVGTPSRGDAVWRFTLVQVGEEGRKKGFACLEDLFVYLRAELASEEEVS